MMTLDRPRSLVTYCVAWAGTVIALWVVSRHG